MDVLKEVLLQKCLIYEIKDYGSFSKNTASINIELSLSLITNKKISPIKHLQYQWNNFMSLLRRYGGQ